MRVRIRFVLMLTLVVSIILLVSFFVIYTLYARNRKNEFDKRIWARAYQEYIQYFNIASIDNDTKLRIDHYSAGTLIGLRAVLLDSAFNIIRINPSNAAFAIDTAFLLTVKSVNEAYYREGDVQSVALYFNKDGHAAYSIVSGYDKYGLARMSTLRLIMFFVALGSVLAIGVFAMYYVIVVTRPLVDMSVQMRRISESSLSQRVKVKKGNIRNNEMVQIATNFNGMLDRLSRAFQMQRNFVHHASHELRTPLATMLSQTESALRRDLTVEQAKKVLESLREDQMSMIELTNSLLLLSQYEHINYSPELPVVRLDELLYDTIAAAKKMLKDITLQLSFPEDNPVEESMLTIKANEAMVRAAFLNLIKNAYKYSDNNTVQIRLEPAQNKILIHFENSGPVMTEEEKDRVFYPFFRGQNARDKKGFGLGLSIVKRILDIHNAGIAYTAVNGTINRFTVSFHLSGEKAKAA